MVFGLALCSVSDIVGKFSAAQMIAIGVVVLFAVLVGLLIGGIAFYRSGIKKGKKRGLKDAVTIAMKKAQEKSENIERALADEKKAAEDAKREKQAALALVSKEREEKQKAIAERDAALAQNEEAKKQAEELKGEIAKAKDETEQAKEDAEKAKSDAERAKEDAERHEREAEEMRLQRDQSQALAAAVPERRTDIKLLSKEEILAFAGDMQDPIPASVYRRGGGELPDSCRVGICTFLLVYERKNMVKLVLRLDKKKAKELEQQFKLFTKAVVPKGGDWFKWILSSEVTDLSVVTAAIRASYEHTFDGAYDAETREIHNLELANREENKINEAIVKYKDLPDRDFVVASDAAEGSAASFRLYGKKEMTAFAKKLAPAYPVKVTLAESDMSPNTFKVGGKTFLMAYEKDGVAKMIFRLSEEDFALLKAKHATADVSPFPKAKGYHWYVAFIDETFTDNADIEEIIKNACKYVHELA